MGASYSSVRHARPVMRFPGALRQYEWEFATMSARKTKDTPSQMIPAPLARAVALHLEGKRKEALRELNGAIEHGTDTPEIYAAKGHIQFELEQYDDAVKSYEKLLDMGSKHPTAHFNLGVCY